MCYLLDIGTACCACFLFQHEFSHFHTTQMVNPRPIIIIMRACIYTVKTTCIQQWLRVPFAECSSLNNRFFYVIKQHIEHLTGNVTRTLVYFIFQGLIFSFDCIVLKRGQNVTPSMAVSLRCIMYQGMSIYTHSKLKKKITAYFLA